MRTNTRRRSIAVSILVLLALTQLLVLPAAAKTPATDSFDRVWARTDQPVADGAVARTWIWGPAPIAPPRDEDYTEAPTGRRTVEYFDKSRMEISHPDTDQSSPWYVTNGLLATELITGRMQTGDNEFFQQLPSEANVAGDQGFANGPSYATFSSFLNPYSAIQSPGDRGTALVVERVDRAGIVTTDVSLEARAVRLTYFDGNTGHNIPAPFWSFMNSRGLANIDGANVEDQLFENPFYGTGRPITEPYWADVVVAGASQLVLLQCFERRCLTYTPSNAPGWQVEAGNIGQHYYAWRYAAQPTIQGQLLFYRGVLNPTLGAYVNDLYIADVHGGEPRNLTDDIDDDIQEATWSPSGDRIAFSAAGDLYVLNPDTGDRVQITSGAEVDATPDWSPDGSQLAFQRELTTPGQRQIQIFIVDSDGTNVRQLTDIPPDPDFSFSTAPDWSPDGQRIAFANENRTLLDTHASGIYVINVDGSDLELVAPPNGLLVSPRWSPAGDALLFLRQQLHGRDLIGSGLYSVDPYATAPQVTTVAGDDESSPYEPVWAPVGHQIAVTMTAITSDLHAGTRGIFTIDTLTGTRTQITHLGDAANWSPDGQYLAFDILTDPTAMTSPLPHVAITDLSGLTQWLVIDDVYHPQWRPDHPAGSP